MGSQQENRDLKLITWKASHSANNHMILEEDTELQKGIQEIGTLTAGPEPRTPPRCA